MSSTKRIVCLANSRMQGGRCIAGREIAGSGNAGSWIRPINRRENEGLSKYENRYGDGTYPKVLDIMSIPLTEPSPQGYQSENWLITPGSSWERTSTYSWDGLHHLLDHVAPLWVDGHSTQQGNNDRVPLDTVDSLPDSLRLIHVDVLEIALVWIPGKSKPGRRGIFQHAGTQYALRITDPKYENLYIQGNRKRQIRDCFLTISLGEPFEGYAYKLIAAIMEQE